MEPKPEPPATETEQEKFYREQNEKTAQEKQQTAMLQKLVGYGCGIFIAAPFLLYVLFQIILPGLLQK